VEYPLSPRAPDALLSLAQLEYARRDRAAARRHFEQILREYPTGPMVAKASYWTARLAFDDGDPSRACAALATAKSTVSREDIELANQIEYYAARCLTASSDSAVSDSAAARDSTERTRPRQEFSVQIASFTRKQDAETMAARLARQGLESRVSGTSAPYRVRVGRYATRDEAARMLARVRRGNPRAIIVEAEPR
jgi:septal ring-binding cell division protein DamX